MTRHLFLLVFVVVPLATAQSQSIGTQPGSASTPGFGAEFGEAAIADDEFGVVADDAAPANANQAPKTNQNVPNPKVPNPFKPQPSEAMMSGMDMMGMMMGEESYDDAGMGGEGYEMDMEMGMGMGGPGMMAGMPSSAAESQFRRGLKQAIRKLREAKDQDVKATLMLYVQEAFQKRYDESIQNRRKELNRIKQRIVELEEDLARREAARDRVLTVQMQSVRLAGEGLIDLNQQ